MLLRAILVLLFASLTFAANWKYEIYVSSSFGVNTTSCWNGRDQTPCVTLNLALQGLQHNSTVIYLYPGTYILDNISKVIDKSNVAIVGLTTKDGGKTVTIKCSSHSGLLFLSSTNIILKSLVLDSCGDIQINPNREFDFQVSVVYMSMCYNVQLIDIIIDSNSIRFNEYTCDNLFCMSSNKTVSCPYLIIETQNGMNTTFPGMPFYIIASVYDCANRKYDWKNDLIACVLSGPASMNNLYYEKCSNVSKIECDHHQNFGFGVILYYNFTSVEAINSSEIILLIQTQGPLIQSLESNISVTLQPCVWPFVMNDSKQCMFLFQDWFCCSLSKYDYQCSSCNDDSLYIKPNQCLSNHWLSSDTSSREFFYGNSPLFYNCGGCPPFQDNCSDSFRNFNASDFSSLTFCAEGRTGRLCGACAPDYGVPINQLNRCVKCDQHVLLGWMLFFLIQLIPVTIMVFIITVFNIQLTNGFMNGLVFYCQIVSVVYPGLTFNLFESYCENDPADNCNYYKYYYIILPCNIFNWNFLPFLLGHALCITSHMTPLQAILFWYIIPTYPLVLLLLIYTWITMYDKGFRCVVTITIPLHRLLARFWHKTKIEPSLIHSIASIYLLCFTQFAATSLQLLHSTKWSVWNNANDNGIAFFYDGTLDYFGWPHSFAGIFAIIVLVFIIFLPMLYIQLYPFKLFHKLLSCLHLRKEILISLGDVFTGSYKNGSDETFDYRYFAGFYLFLRIIVLCLHFIPYENGVIFLLSQEALFVTFGGMIMIFRPYRKNSHNFGDFFIIIFLALMNILMLYLPARYTQKTILGFSLFVFGVIICGYYLYSIIRKIWNNVQYCRADNQDNSMLNEQSEDIQTSYILVDNDDWIADRIEHPDDYDEQHVQCAPYDLHVSQPQDITGSATYGSVSNPELTGTCNSDIVPLSTRDTRSTVAVSDKLSIPLHPIASETDDATSITVNEDVFN